MVGYNVSANKHCLSTKEDSTMSIAQTTDKFTNNLRAVFTDKQISTNVTYTYVQNFKDTIGFRPVLEQHLQQYDGLKAQNSTYSIADAVIFMVDAVFQGYSRFSHMEELRKDQAYLSICGGAAPSEKVCRDTHWHSCPQMPLLSCGELTRNSWQCRQGQKVSVRLPQILMTP